MKLKLYTKAGPSEKEITLSPVFEESLNEKHVAEYINYVRNAMRQPIADTKDRSEVRGGGRKPWRQKGTGNARVGSNRSPLWVGGGVTFGPSRNQTFATRLNKKFRAKTRASIFAHYANNKRFMIIDSIDVKDAKTKSAEKLLTGLNLEGKISLFVGSDEMAAKRAYRNLPYVSLMSRSDIDMIALVSSDYLVMTQMAYKEMFEGKEANVDK